MLQESQAQNFNLADVRRYYTKFSLDNNCLSMLTSLVLLYRYDERSEVQYISSRVKNQQLKNLPFKSSDSQRKDVRVIYKKGNSAVWV